MNSESIYKTLVTTHRSESKLQISDGLLKPCVADLLERGLCKGSLPDRTTGGLIIASELRRIGKSENYVLSFLKEWNFKNSPSLRISKIQGIVRSAYKKEYRYSCNSEYLKVNCVGEEFCSFAKNFTKFRKYNNNRRFLDLGWQLILPNISKCIYYIAIPELERRLGVGAGGVVIANYKRIAYFAGISVRSVKAGLLYLVKKTPLLLKCKIGTSRKWERNATVIQRRIPIPPPSEDLKRKKKNCYDF